MKIKSLLFAAILATALFGFTGADAQNLTIAQLQAEIANLMAQIQVLQNQQPTAQAWCYDFNANLGVNQTDSNTNGGIYNLQIALNKQGFITQDNINQDNGAGANALPASFGENTAAAVVQFQQKYGIRASGWVGPVTRAKLNLLYGCVASTPAPTPACSNLYWFDNSTFDNHINNTCQTSKQFCGAYMYYGLQTFGNQQDCINAWNKVIGKGCTPNWTCGWGLV